MSKNSLQISNSFTFNFTNTTNSVQEVTLFQEGINNGSSVQEVYTTGQTTYLNNTFPTIFQISWTPIGAYKFYFFNNPLATTITQYPTSLLDVQIKDTGNVRLTSDVFSFLDVPVTAGENLQIVNDRINQYLRDFATTGDFRSPSGQVMVFNFTFDFSIFQLSPLPIQIDNLGVPYLDPIGLSVQYPLDSTIKLFSIDFTGSPINPAFANIQLSPLSVTSSANGVEVRDGSSVTYSEIKQSQNGGALDIDSLVINIGSAPSDFEKQSQLLQPFRFKKIDVNGNEYEIQKVQVIDPYQYQYSFGKVDMTDEGQNFVLDGNTRFVYNVEPQTSVNITYNYIQARNSTFGLQSGQEELNRDLKNIAELDEESTEAKELVFSNFTQESNVTQPTNNVSNKTKLLIPLLLGGIALYLLFNLKPNQK